MPAKTTWLHRVTEICEEIQALDTPIVDRCTAERLFRLQRRQAIKLLHNFGGFQVGRTLVIKKEDLLVALERLKKGESFEWEVRRKQRIATLLEEARQEMRRRRVEVVVDSRVRLTTLAAMSTDIHLEPDELVIKFSGSRRICSKSWSSFRRPLQTIGNNFKIWGHGCQIERNNYEVASIFVTKKAAVKAWL